MHYIRCGLLLQTQKHGQSVCLSCLLVKFMSPAKTAELIEMPFERLHIRWGSMSEKSICCEERQDGHVAFCHNF